MGDGGPEQRKNTVAGRLHDIAVVAADGVHHQLERRVDNLAGVFWIEVLHHSIDPLMSANSAVTVLRSPSSDADEALGAIRIADSAAGCGLAAAAVDVVNDAPHSPQNFSPGWLEAPHFEQVRLSGAPQFAQNLRPSRLSLPHFEQRMFPVNCPSGTF